MPVSGRMHGGGFSRDMTLFRLNKFAFGAQGRRDRSSLSHGRHYDEYVSC